MMYNNCHSPAITMRDEISCNVNCKGLVCIVVRSNQRGEKVSCDGKLYTIVARNTTHAEGLRSQLRKLSNYRLMHYVNQCQLLISRQ